MTRKYLTARFDITDLDQVEVDALTGEVAAQAEASDDYTEGLRGHRSVEVEFEVAEPLS